MLVIFRVINIFQKDRNFIFYFVIYLYKINILPSTWDHTHAIIEENFLTCSYKN